MSLNNFIVVKHYPLINLYYLNSFNEKNPIVTMCHIECKQ